MTGRLSILLRRAKDVLQEEGLATLFRHSFDFIRPRIFQYGNYYLYEHSMRDRDKAALIPRIQDFTSEIVCSNEEADELAASAGYDFRRCYINARRNLDKGAIAFCIFVDGAIAHIGWVALSEEAKETLDHLPVRIDFSGNVAYSGASETIPKYRGMGLLMYSIHERHQFLLGKGIASLRSAVDIRNAATQRVHAKFGSKIYGRARCIKVLCWKFWKETPITQTGH